VPESGGGFRRWLKSLWVWEVWLTIRPTFILLVGDAALFLFLMVILALGHHVIEWVPASPERRTWLEDLHFYLITGAWIFFSMTLFIELFMAFRKRIKEHFKHQEQSHG
jgi:hypothetical protein